MKKDTTRDGNEQTQEMALRMNGYISNSKWDLKKGKTNKE